MRIVPDTMTTAWKSEVKIGNDRRPVVRATIQAIKLARWHYDKGQAPGEDFAHQFNGKGIFTSAVFGQERRVREIHNLLRCSWSRSVEQDVAECTLTVLNSRLVPIGTVPMDDPEEFDKPGWLSPGRGKVSNPWGYTPNGWADVMVPDRLVKTYEGYGTDPDVPPDLDPHLIQSGTWIIDDAAYSTDGNIELRMRDLGRLLIDQIVMPPLIPYTEYPMMWSRIRSTPVDGVEPTGGRWVAVGHGYKRGSNNLAGRGAHATSSNTAYLDADLTNEPHPYYVNSYGAVQGHKARDALLGVDEEFWASTGQPSTKAWVWWQADLNDPVEATNAVRLRLKGGPYRVYISLRGPNGWYGKRRIPYDRSAGAGGVGIAAGIPFVDTVLVNAGAELEHVLKRRYRNVESIRLTFTRLRDTGVGEYPFRAELKGVDLYTGTFADLATKDGEIIQTVGNYKDYTDIVKWVCAWAGFWWPPHSTGQDQMRRTDGTHATYTYDSPDARLPRGRVWGDFMNSGTAGQSDLTVDLFDKQPFMDVISYVRDTLGFLFFIDETGAPVWRLPNLWKAGNYLSPGQQANRNTRARTQDYVTLTDTEDLLAYSTKLSSRELRERVFVANSTGRPGVVAKAFRPYEVGFRRIAGWTDQNFETKRETVVMADMIAAAQMFTYRTSTLTIDGYPAIQIDDQIRIFERMTSETYWHYVKAISSDIDMRAGSWTYQLETHWLGPTRDSAWVVDATQLNPATQNYLELLEDGVSG